MALTPDDLLNMEFPETKFRPGYDKDEVDDFLDEVVVEWRRLIQENEDLQAKVSTLEEQIEDHPSNLEPDDLKDAGLSGYAGSSGEVTGTFEAVDRAEADAPAHQDDAAVSEADTEDSDAEASTEEAPAPGAPEQDRTATAYPEYPLGTREAQPRPAEAGAAAATPSDSTGEVASNATGVLAMAQRLHDQYVAEGEQTRAAYIAEGEQTRAAHIAEGEQTRAAAISEGESVRDEHISEAERRKAEIVTEAETRAENMIEEAELTSTRTLAALERKKTDLETKVSELTGFERDYRARLKDYIEGQLADLNSRGSIEKEATGAEL